MSSAKRLLGPSMALVVALVSHSSAKENSLTVGPLSVNASVFSAFTYVAYDTIKTRDEPDWSLRPISAVSSFNARASLRVSERAEVVAQVRGRSRSGFPRNSVMPREMVYRWYEEDYWYGRDYYQYYETVEPPKESFVDIGDLYVIVETPGARYRITAGRFVVPIGMSDRQSDNAATPGRPFAINPLLMDAIAGSSVDLPREIGARVDVVDGRSMLSLVATSGMRRATEGSGYDNDADHYSESMTVVGRGALLPDGPATAGFSMSVFYTADTDPRHRGNYEGDWEDRSHLVGAMIDVRALGRGGSELSGGIAALVYNDGEARAKTLYALVATPVGSGRVSAGFSAWLPRGVGSDDDRILSRLPVVGYSVYRPYRGEVPGLAAHQRVCRFQVGVDVPLADGVELHGECLADRFSDGIVKHRADDHGYEFQGITTVAAMVGIRAAI